jgi:lipopolysaccharide/colanic/teichoic acid biosynthesis glycosyltransferase
MRQQRQAMGIRTAAARVETLGAGDVTLRGTYWYDLRTRRPLAAAVKRALDLVIAVPLLALCTPFLLAEGKREKRTGFRGHEFLMYTRWFQQLRHVVEGTMSLVGPRPMAPDEVHRSDARRFSVRPGMTGLWRIDGGEERDLDRRYVNEWSVAQDLRILARTVMHPRPVAPRP